MSYKGLILFTFSILVFNIGLSLNNVDKDVIMYSVMGISIIFGPWFISGRIFNE